MKKTLISAAAIAVLAVSGCGSSSTDGTSSSSSSAPSTVAITSWATWADHYGNQVQDCAGQDDTCFTENHTVIAEMRQSIIDHDLPIDGTNSLILNPMQAYQDNYADFTAKNCLGSSRSMDTANVVCNVNRQQLETSGRALVSALNAMT